MQIFNNFFAKNIYLCTFYYNKCPKIRIFEKKIVSLYAIIFGIMQSNRHIVIFCAVLMLCFVSCTAKRQERAAQQHVNNAAELVKQHRYEAALQQIDSVNSLYPKQIAQRKQAKAIKDTIVYLQSQQTLRFADSILQPLLPEVDKLLKKFRYEKNDAYEDHGHYVYRELQTGWNTNRCFLQTYVTDDRKTLVKSYYYGAKPIHQTSVMLQAGDQEIQQQGQNHAFEVEGWHEVLTIADDQALEVLNFVSAHLDNRIRVKAQGNGSAVYYLSDNEKQALDQTYRLGLLMRDIDQLEQQIRLASQRIQHFENKKNVQDNRE